jgi:hypothetical protein
MARKLGSAADNLEGAKMLTAAQKIDLLKSFTKTASENLDRYALRASHHDATGEIEGALAERETRERRMAEVYRLLATGGPAAALAAADRDRLQGKGFDAEDIEMIKAYVQWLRGMWPLIAADGTIAPRGKTGLLGPNNETLGAALTAIGAGEDAENIDGARRVWMQAVAAAFDAVTQSRFGPGAKTMQGQGATPPSPAPSIAPVATSRPDVDYTISGQMNRMIEAKRGVEWKLTKRGEQTVCDTAEQFATLGRFLIKMKGGDDVRLLTKSDASALRSQLHSLPTTFGKSPGDWALAFEEAILRGKTRGAKFGRSPSTTTRWLTQLQSFVSYLKASDVVDVAYADLKRLKPKDKRKPNARRGVLKDADLVALFGHETWTGSAVVHDSLYWVPILGRYTMGRVEELCGLLVVDVDLAAPVPALEIRNNALRTIKTEERRIPLHSELLRLGFAEYVERIRSVGRPELFPDLTARGKRTALGSLFYKRFSPILRATVPDAEEKSKTFHSLRKAGNTIMRDALVADSILNAILGHADSGTNARVYLEPASDPVKARALETLTIVTAAVPAQRIRLPQARGALRRREIPKHAVARTKHSDNVVGDD